MLSTLKRGVVPQLNSHTYALEGQRLQKAEKPRRMAGEAVAKCRRLIIEMALVLALKKAEAVRTILDGRGRS